jgi:hypothetical protein
VSEPGDADEYGVTDGYHDISGVWHPTSPVTRAALHAAIGHPQPGPPLWFVPVGATERLHSACHLTLEDGRDRGVVGQLPSDIPIGYHRLRPVNGGPVTRLFVHPDRCPAPPAGWGVAAQLYSTSGIWPVWRGGSSATVVAASSSARSTRPTPAAANRTARIHRRRGVGAPPSISGSRAWPRTERP